MRKRLLASILAVAMMLTMAPFAFAVDENKTTNQPDWIEHSDSTVYWQAGGKSGYATTLKAALDEAQKDNTNDVTITCKPSSTVTTEGTHYNVTNNLTIDANQADFGGVDISIGKYVAPKNETTTVTINDAKNLVVWGQPTSRGDVWNVNLNGCENSGYDLFMYRWNNTSTDTINLKVTNCKASGYNDSIIHTTADGSIEITGCEFSDNCAPVNIAHKQSGAMKVSITNSKFTKCGYENKTEDLGRYAAPIRVTNNSAEGTVTATVDNVTISDTVGSNGDILIGDGRTGKTSTDVSLTVKNTAATVMAQKPGYYNANGEVANDSLAQSSSVTADQEFSTSIYNYVAQIGSAKYESLSEAVNAAESGKTVTLLKDVTGQFKISEDKNFTLDLNGHTITAPDTDRHDAIINNGTLTISDSQKTGAIVSPLNGGVTTKSNATTTINYAKVTGQEGALCFGSDVTGATLIVNDGVFTGVDNAVVADNGNKRTGVANTVTINGGVFNGKIQSNGYVACGIYAPWNDMVTVNGGTFNITKGAGIVARAGNVTVNGGTFNTTGDVTGKVGDSRVVVPCSAIVFDSDAKYSAMTADSKITVTGGTFNSKAAAISTVSDKARVSVSGGVYSSDVNDYAAPGYKADKTNGVWIVKSSTNDAINAIDAAVKAIDTQDEDVATKIDNAIVEIAKIPNETLSSNSSTMDNLAKLDEELTKEGGSVTVKTEGSALTDLSVKNAALSADTDTDEGTNQTIIIKAETTTGVDTSKAIDAAGIDSSTTTPNTQALNITMTKQVGTAQVETITEPTAPVVLTFKLPENWANAQIVYVDGDKTELVKTTVSNGKISGVFNHFSTYVLVETNASKNPNEYEIILTPDQEDVSAGDTINYTVELKHVEGDGKLGMFTFVPDVTSGLLTGGTFTVASNDVKAEYGPVDNTNQNKLVIRNLDLEKGRTLTIGTLSYKVDAYGIDGTKIEYTGSSKGSVSNNGRPEGATVELVNAKDVTYHVVKVTFQSADGTDTVGYVKYGTKTPLYKELTDLRDKTTNTVDVPVLNTDTTGGTTYRVLDVDWYLSTDENQTYQNMTGFQTSVTFNEKFVKLAKVNIQKDTEDNALVEIIPNNLITRTNGDDVYVDQGVDLTFKLTDKAKADAGMEYVVKAKIGNADAREVSADDNGPYKILGTDITDEVTITLEQKLALTKDDIKIFKDTDTTQNNATIYRPFSVYSEKRTLVLIKGAQGAKYAFDDTAVQHPTIYATDAYEGGYTLAVLIDPTNVQEVDGTSVSEAAMLAYMVDTLKLNAVTRDDVVNPKITYDYATNGNINSDPLVHAQVARDFTQMIKGTEHGWYWEPGDELLLKADVITKGTGDAYNRTTYTGKPDGHVETDDIATFMYLHVGMPKTSTP